MQGIIWMLNKNGEALAMYEAENARLKAENDQLRAQLAEQQDDKVPADGYERVDI